MNIENNKVVLIGTMENEFEFCYEVFGELFYTAMIASERMSGAKDVIPIVVSERLVDMKEDWAGKAVKIYGQFRSFNKKENGKSRLILSVFVNEWEVLDGADGDIPPDEDHIFLDGYICKQPTYRKTPLGRDISDVMLAVNRNYGKTDYIPTICWGRNARFAEGLEVGTRLKVDGRIQSREYKKRISGDEFETRTAYEISVSRMEVAEDEQSEDRRHTT